MALLDIKNLTISFDTLDGTVNAVNDLSFSLEKSETLAIVGESGSGKTQAMLGIMGLLASNGHASGEILFNNQSLLSMPAKNLNKIRGKDIAMIFQDPMTSLNPYLRISTQMTEVLVHHEGMDEARAKQRAVEMLDLVKIPDAKKRIDYYPHEFSGGMRQRVAIAMALLCHPQIIIADEPTTALDVTVQAQILKLFGDIKQEFNTAIIMITHDLGVVASVAEQVLVLYAGQMMELGSLDDIYYSPENPYTRGLLHSAPRANQKHDEVLYSIPGNPPNMLETPSGCPFHLRCEFKDQLCLEKRPNLIETTPGHWKACHRENLPLSSLNQELSNQEAGQ